MGLVAQHLKETGRANAMLVGPFMLGQALSADPLFVQMEDVIKENR